MKIFKSNVVLNFAVALFFCLDVQAMGAANIDENAGKFFDIKMPLKQWPIVNSLTTQKEADWYKLTWDTEKTLEENKKALTQMFLTTCCDFSFRRKKEELKGITVGRLNDNEDIIFSETGTNISARPDSSEVLIYNKKDQSKGLKVHMTTNIFLNIKPLNFTESMKADFEKAVSELAEDPVGCEVLRVAVSKYKGGVGKLQKIAFIPVANKGINLAYTTSSNVWKYIRRNSVIHPSKYRKFCKDSKFIMFSPEWFTAQQTGFFLRMNRYQNGQIENFALNTGIIPKEVSLIHQIIYALNVGENHEYREVQTIGERVTSKYFHGSFKKIGDCIISGKQINYSLFVDDKIYRAMYGLSKDGLDLINESSYLAHKYGFIRPTYIGVDTELRINGKKLNKAESFNFLKAFLKTNGDHDLFRYYLSPESAIIYPEFGVGRYSCSDINVDEKHQI